MSNRIKRILCCAFLILLTGCATTTTGKIVKEESDDITSFRVDGKCLYIIGNSYSYEFLIHNTYNLADIIQSEYYKKIKFIDATASINVDNKDMYATYALYFSTKDLTPEQQKELVNEYGFIQITINNGNREYWITTVSPELKTEFAQESDLLMRSYYLSEGQPTPHEKQSTPLHDYLLSIPVQLHIKHSKLRKEADPGKTFDELPETVKIVLGIPYLFWGAATK
ncbi:hypothetical protein [Providencia rettgeri]|uniref:hypothetical protein n=1 Tax=Providencia rettgeri TaxID=587 RepID=UPI00313EA065